MPTKTKVGIIGAGLAGLTAAYRLFQKGVDVDLLEARNRVGGRVFSVLMKNYLGNYKVIELGGQNITDGGSEKGLINLIEDLSLEIDTRIVNFNSLVHFDNQYFDLHKTFSEHFKGHDNVNKLVDTLATKSKSIGELIDKLSGENFVLKQALTTRITAYEGVKANNQSVYHNIDTLKAIIEGGIAKAHKHYGHMPYQVVIKSVVGGNSRLPMTIAEKLKDNIYLNKPLSKIEMVNDKVNLSFEDGEIKTYDLVILTVPVLTYKNIEFMGDLIPTKRLDSIQKISYGNNYKTAFSWNLDNLSNYRGLITDQAIAFFNQDETIPLLYATKVIPDLSDTIKVVKKGLNINDNNDIKNINLARDQNFEFYTDSVTHIWPTDKYAYGSYSGYSNDISEALDKKVTYRNVEFKELFSPIADKLFFAGEHTTLSDSIIGTMEAAVESGNRVAKSILATIV